MSNQQLNIEHLCNTARRQVADEFKDLNLVFIVHPSGKRAEMLGRARDQLLGKPYGKAAFDILQRHESRDSSVFAGFLKCEPKGPLRFFQKISHAALFFINSDQSGDSDAARIPIYNLLWQALDIARVEMGKGKRRNLPDLKLEESDGVLIHKQDKMSQARHNMMADIFAGVLLELQGHKSEIHKLAKRRAEESISRVPGNHPEQRPYPVALEACDIVFQDLKSVSRDKPFSLALNIAREVADTLGDDSIRQWWGFTERAQQMAWMGGSPQDVINTSIYTSEDTYVKAAAYIVSEILEMEPQMVTNLTSYNLFTEAEVNAHLHDKQCEKDAKHLAEQCVLQEKQDIYETALRAQCENLVSGKPLGWAPLACADAMLTLQREAEDPDLTGSSVKNAYLESARSLPWAEIEKLLKLIVRVIRKKGAVQIEEIPALMRKIETLEPHAERLENLLKGVPEQDEKAASLEEISKHDPTAVLDDDDYLEMDEDLTKGPVKFD